jgi:hypothetical protein
VELQLRGKVHGSEQGFWIREFDVEV